MPYVDVGTHRLWVTEKGAGSPVVLLHPLFFDARVFEPIAAALAEEHRVLAVDVRDHGRSEAPPQPWSLATAAGEVQRVLDELDVPEAHVVGISMGGMIAMRWALAHPDSVRSLVLISTSAETEPRAWLHKAMAQAVRVAGRPATRALLPYAVRRMFSEAGREDPAAEEWRQRIAAMDPGSLYRAGQAVFDREAILDRVDAIEAPTLVVTSEDDPAIPREHGQRLAEAIPEAELAEVPGPGHVLTLEAPEAVEEEIVHFLRRAEAHAAVEDPGDVATSQGSS